MTVLGDVTDAELRAEMERRAKRKAAGRMLPTPAPDFKELVKFVTKGVEHAEATGHEPKDFRQHVYEMALGTVYGPGFWRWYNEIHDD